MTDRTRHIKDVLWFLTVFGAVAILLRLVFGLGATTNLCDAVPWGLWKILNMVAGVALATGGFTVGLLVYVLKIERLRPLVKPAILVAFLGYGSSVFALCLDIGLPHRIWHPILMWNPRSFLFEVAMCVMLYFTVTIVELAPTLLERWPGSRRAVTALHRITPGLAIFGITLSSLHHTSLGSLFLVTPQRLHPLWYTTWIPVLFITSAMGAGMMTVVLVKLLHSRWYGSSFMPGDGLSPPVLVCVAPTALESPQRDHELSMLRTLASIAAAVLGLYLALKTTDLIRTGAWQQLLTGTWESWLYVLELVLTAVVPIVLMAMPAVRRTAAGLAAAATSAILGMVLNRLDVGIFGYLRDASTVYVPSLAEWAVSLGVIAAAGLVLLFVVERFAVFDDVWVSRQHDGPPFSAGFGRLSGVWALALGNPVRRVTLIAVFAAPLAWAALYPPYRAAAATGVSPPVAADAQRAVLRIDGNRQAMTVRFAHADHRERLGGELSCSRCHHLALPSDHASPCSRCHRSMERATRIFDHTAHFAGVADDQELMGLHPGNHSCRACHAAGQTKSRTSARGCLDCHRNDMKPAREPGGRLDLEYAPGYRVAMHATCIPCHRREAEQRERPRLAECTTCHPPSSALGRTEGRLDSPAPRSAGT